MLSRIIAAFVIYITLAVTDHTEILPEWLRLWGKMALYLVPYVLIRWDIVYKAFRNVRNGQAFDENFLMIVATFGAFGVGEYSEAVTAVLSYQMGELFQSYAANHSRQSIMEFTGACSEYANTEEDGQPKRVESDDVQVGDIIVVKAGERTPFDGKAVFGNSMVDTSAPTGESVSRKVAEGDDIISGCANGSGLLQAQVTKEFDDPTVVKILELMENASSKKAHVENFITRFARYYTPLVVIGTMLLAMTPPLFLGQSWSEGVRRVCTFLVVPRPCAPVISVPMGFFSGIGIAPKKGVLIKGSNYLKALSEMDTIAFDKIGMLTKGEFKVTEIHAVTGSPVPEASEIPRTRAWAISQPSDEEKRSLLELAALAESYSDHPILRSIKDAWGDTIDINRISNAQEISGHGVQAEMDSHTVLAGNSKLMKEMNVAYRERMSMGMVVYAALDGVYCGYIVIADPIKDEAFKAIKNLKKVGVGRTVMLTGDKKEVREAVATRLGLDEVHAGLLPGDKVTKVEELLVQQTGEHRLAFVGGRINDAPILFRADVDTATGSMGSDAVIEATDIMSMDDNPARVANVAHISRKIISIVKQNIVFALGVRAVVSLVGVVGMVNMWGAVFTDVGMSVIAILNTMRALSL